MLPDDHAALGQELVTLLTGERGDLSSSEHRLALAALLSEAKVDWRSQRHLAERLELLKATERLSEELRAVGGHESLEGPARRVRLSGELLGGEKRRRGGRAPGKYDVGGPGTPRRGWF